MNYFILILIAIAGVISGMYFGRRKGRDLNKKTNQATLTCPKCNYKQEVEIPQDKCLPFHKCESCNEVISVPKDSINCCVVCEYSDKSCPTKSL